MKKETKLRARDECRINYDLFKDDHSKGYFVAQKSMRPMGETEAGLTDQLKILWMMNQVSY